MLQPLMTREIVIPTMHADQVQAWRVASKVPLFALRCGRRWGKTKFGETIGGDDAAKARSVGWFAPDYKRMSEVYEDFRRILAPITTRASKTDKEIRTTSGGGIDFWTLEDEDAGRGRFYHRVVVDEGAFTDNKSMMGTWEKSIKPTLLDFGGSAMVLSNTNGVNPENFFWRICNQPQYGFRQYHAPSFNNPHVPRRLPTETREEWLARRRKVFIDLRASEHPLVFAQEYLAEFVDWSGVAFFQPEKLLNNGVPVPRPDRCDGVFAVIDTATKTGKENDGTGVVYYALDVHGAQWPLTILDYDLAQIEGSLLEAWLPVVFQQLDVLAIECGARSGSLGVWIEDKASGMVLLQQAARREWKAQPIDSGLTAVGKSERAISVSGYVYRERVKISVHAFNKTVLYKGVTRNHLLGQVVDFRVGSKDQVDDDLLDCFTYGIAIGLGNAEGF